jgi:hypothetical protein
VGTPAPIRLSQDEDFEITFDDLDAAVPPPPEADGKGAAATNTPALKAALQRGDSAAAATAATPTPTLTPAKPSAAGGGGGGIPGLGGAATAGSITPSWPSLFGPVAASAPLPQGSSPTEGCGGCGLGSAPHHTTPCHAVCDLHCCACVAARC